MDEGFTIEFWIQFTSFLTESGAQIELFYFDVTGGNRYRSYL